MHPVRAAAVVGVAALLATGCARTEPEGRWRLVLSEHFVVRTDAEPRVYQPIIDRLEDVHEALARSLFSGVPLAGRAPILLFAHRRDFAAIAPAGLVGFYADVPGFDGAFAEGLMVFSAEGDFAAAADTGAHELAHHFLHALSDHVPTWLHEGFAKYAGAHALTGQRLAFDVVPISDEWARGATPVSLARLLAAGGSDFHGASARAQYLTAWLLVRALLENPDDDTPARFQELVAKAALARTPEAAAAAIAGMTHGRALAELEAEVRATHEALRAGKDQWPGHAVNEARATVAVTLSRHGRQPLVEAVADAREIAKLRDALTGLE